MTATLQAAHAAAKLTYDQLTELLAVETQTDARLDLVDPGAFFGHVRGRLWPRLSVEQVQGCERIIGMCGRARLPLADGAYVLATDYHETAYAMQPVREKGGEAYLRKYDTGRLAQQLGNTPEADGDGILYAGRGDVQLTGYANYLKATTRLRELGVIGAAEDLTVTPDLALRPDVSAAVLVYGMAEGWFTGRKLSAYLPRTGEAAPKAFEKARPIVNGTDRAAMIAGYAVHFQRALQLGGYGQ